MVQFATNEEDGGSNPSVGTAGNVAESGLRHLSRKQKGGVTRPKGSNPFVSSWSVALSDKS